MLKWRVYFEGKPLFNGGSSWTDTLAQLVRQHDLKKFTVELIGYKRYEINAFKKGIFYIIYGFEEVEKPLL